MELRVRGDRAVLSGSDAAGAGVRPEELPLDPDLTIALHEWARVAAAVGKASKGESEILGQPSDNAVGVVSRRGYQLARRIAAQMKTPVFYRDPVTDVTTVVVPSPDDAHPAKPRHASGAERQGSGEPTPWGTGLIVSVVFAVVVTVAVVALAAALARATNGWMALGATVVVTGGMLPSLWLGRHVPIVRWVCFGAAAGLAGSWVGLAFVLF